MNILAFGAHPLDIALLCGGTLAKYAAQGHRVTMLSACQPVPGNVESAEADLQRHLQEYREAGAVIGAGALSLDMASFGLCDDSATRARVAQIVRETDAHVLLTHDEADYVADHRVVGELAESAMHMAKQPGVALGLPSLRHHVEIVCMDTVSGLGFEPEQYVDITEVMETKRSMARCFATDVEAWRHNPVVETLEWIEVSARFRGIQCGVRYAEAFRRSHRWGRMAPERVLP